MPAPTAVVLAERHLWTAPKSRARASQKTRQLEAAQFVGSADPVLEKTPSPEREAHRCDVRHGGLVTCGVTGFVTKVAGVVAPSPRVPKRSTDGPLHTVAQRAEVGIGRVRPPIVGLVETAGVARLEEQPDVRVGISARRLPVVGKGRVDTGELEGSRERLSAQVAEERPPLGPLVCYK